MLRAEDRPEPVEAIAPEPRLYDLAEGLPGGVARVVVVNVPGRPVDAFLLAASSHGAEIPHLLGIAHGCAGDIAPVGLEADVDGGGARLDLNLLAAPAPVRGLHPVAADVGKDVRGDEQVAVELVAALDDLAVARIEQVLRAQPPRAQAEGRALILHEDAAAAHDGLRRLEVVAVLERLRQVEAGVEHQPVAEAMVALVVVECVGPDLRVVAGRAGDACDSVGSYPGELPLQEPVVVAGAAGAVPGGECLAHVALVVEQAAGSDLVRDRVAVAPDDRVRG